VAGIDDFLHAVVGIVGTRRTGSRQNEKPEQSHRYACKSREKFRHPAHRPIRPVVFEAALSTQALKIMGKHI
jgi:hypothetical protein